MELYIVRMPYTASIVSATLQSPISILGVGEGWVGESDYFVVIFSINAASTPYNIMDSICYVLHKTNIFPLPREKSPNTPIPPYKTKFYSAMVQKQVCAIPSW